MRWPIAICLIAIPAISGAQSADQAQSPKPAPHKAVRTFTNDNIGDVTGTVSQNDAPASPAQDKAPAAADPSKPARLENTKPVINRAPTPEEIKKLLERQTSLTATLASIDAQLAKETDPNRREALGYMKENVTEYLGDVKDQLEGPKQGAQQQPVPKSAPDAQKPDPPKQDQPKQDQ